MGELLTELSFKLPDYFNQDNRHYWAVKLVEVHEKVPLDLRAMLKYARAGGWDLAEVTHDFGGIQKHWDGERFNDCFSPRFAVRQ